MREKDNGGPAYPVAWTNYHNSVNYGMTVRDHFAGLALQGLLSSINFYNEHGSYLYQEIAVKKAFEIADAMLAEREKP